MTVRILQGDAREQLVNLSDRSVHLAVTSPPYFNLRSYIPAGHPDKAKEMGSEKTPDEFVSALVGVFDEVRRVLRDDGICMVNLGDSYAATGKSGGGRQGNAWNDHGAQTTGPRGGKWSPAPVGLKPKDLMMIPARFALAMQADGWFLRSAMPWIKRSVMPESVSGSQYIRHRITISDYERMSGLRKTRECPVGKGGGDLSGLQASEVFGGKATLSAEPEGVCHDPCLRRDAGDEGEAQASGVVTARTQKPSQIQCDGEGAGHEGASDPKIPKKRPRQESVSRETLGDERQPDEDRTKASSQRKIRQIRKDGGQEAPGLRAAEERDSRGQALHGGNVVGDNREAQASLLLLQETPSLDVGSCDAGEQGGAARRREHRSGLSDVQLEEEQQDSPSLLVDCPGCEQCSAHNGYILSMSAGRPTSAVEYVFMFTKQPRYFWDATAVQQRGAIPAGTRAAKGSNVRSDLKDVNGRPPEYWDYTGMRNFRNSDLFFSTLGEPFGLITDADGTPIALDVNPEPLADHHFAAYPSKLVHPLILAGTSERGCCAACGAPWVRQTEKSKGQSDRQPRGKALTSPRQDGNPWNEADGRGFLPTTVTTAGWLPSCQCDAGEPVPCTILDCFAGACTSLLVADRLGRDAIGIELNEEYVAMGRRRLEKDAGLFASIAAQ